MAMLMSFMGLSSAATRLELSFPQRLQRWMMAHSPPLRTQTATDSMMPQQAFQRFWPPGANATGAFFFIHLTGVSFTKFCAAPAQGRRSRWAWTKSRSCRFPRRCGGPRQRRWRSWQGSGVLPAPGRPVREFSGWRYSHP